MGTRRLPRGVISEDGLFFIRPAFNGKRLRIQVPDAMKGEDLFRAIRRNRKFGTEIPEHLRDLAAPYLGLARSPVVLVRDLLDDYLVARSDRATIEDMKRDACFWKEHMGKLEVRARTKGQEDGVMQTLLAHIQQGKKKLAVRGLSPYTVDHHLRTLRAAFMYAEREAATIKLAENPFHYKIGFCNPRRTPPRLDFKCFVDIIRRCPPRPRMVAIFLALTGRRVSEALKIKWTEVRFDTGEYYCEPAKGGQAAWYRLPALLITMLAKLPHCADEPRVFPMSRNYVSHSFKRAVRKVVLELERPDLAKLRLHDLRHATSSWGSAIGAADRTLQAMLGHRTLTMTAGYTHPEMSTVGKVQDGIARHLIDAGLTEADYDVNRTHDSHVTVEGGRQGKSAPRSAPQPSLN